MSETPSNAMSGAIGGCCLRDRMLSEKCAGSWDQGQRFRVPGRSGSAGRKENDDWAAQTMGVLLFPLAQSLKERQLLRIVSRQVLVLLGAVASTAHVCVEFVSFQKLRLSV